MKLLVILGSGGHTAEMLKLIDLMGNDYEYEYVIQKEDKLSEDKIKHKGEIYYVNSPHRFGDNIIMKILRTLRLFFQAYEIIMMSPTEAVISSGPGVCLPFFVLAKSFTLMRIDRKKTIFVETFARIESKSETGKLVERFIDLLFIQWKEMKKVYPQGIYAGRLA